MSRKLIEIGKLKELLADDAEQVARELLPKGHREGRHWREATKASGGWGDSLICTISGPSKGQWYWFAPGKGGDLLDLYCLVYGCKLGDAIDWAMKRLGLDVEAVAIARDRATPPKPKDDGGERESRRAEIMRKRAAAKRLWLECQPRLLGTPVEAYLAGRGIDLPKLVEARRGLGALRFHPGLEHRQAGTNFPAIVALVIGPTGKICGVHRTYLLERGRSWDHVREKVDGFAGRMLWCPIHGGVTPLWRGERIDAATGEIKTGRQYTDETAGPEIVLCEGIEKGLSIAQEYPSKRVATVLNLVNWRDVRLPPQYRSVIWAGDRMPDVEAWVLQAMEEGRAAGLGRREIERGAERAQRAAELIHELDREGCERLIGEGREVRVARPPAGWNDWDDERAA